MRGKKSNPKSSEIPIVEALAAIIHPAGSPPTSFSSESDEVAQDASEVGSEEDSPSPAPPVSRHGSLGIHTSEPGGTSIHAPDPPESPTPDVVPESIPNCSPPTAVTTAPKSKQRWGKRRK